MWVSNWSLHNAVCASIAPYGAVEGKEKIGKLLTPKANKATKSGNGSFKHVPAPLARQRWSWEGSTEKVPSAQCSFQGRGEQQGLFLWFSCVSQEGSKDRAVSPWGCCCRRGRSVAARREQLGTSGEQPGPAALPALSGCFVCTRSGSAVQAAIM